MTHTLNRCAESSTKTGDGATVVLGGALTGRSTFAVAAALQGLSAGASIYAVVETEDGAVWEAGIYTLGVGEIERTSILATSLGNTTAVDFQAGAKRVVSSRGAEKDSEEIPLARLPDVTGPTVLGRVTGTGVVGALTPAEAQGIILPPLAADDWWAGDYVGGHTASTTAATPWLVLAALAAGTTAGLSSLTATGQPPFGFTWRCHATNDNSGYRAITTSTPWMAGLGMRVLVRIMGTTVRSWFGWSIAASADGVCFFFDGLDVVARVGTDETVTTYTLNTDEWFWLEFDGLADNSGATFRVRRAVDGVVVWEETKTGTMPVPPALQTWRNQAIYPTNPGGAEPALQFGAWFIGTPNGLRHATGRP